MFSRIIRVPKVVVFVIIKPEYMEAWISRTKMLFLSLHEWQFFTKTLNRTPIETLTVSGLLFVLYKFDHLGSVKFYLNRRIKAAPMTSSSLEDFAVLCSTLFL